MLSAFIRKSSSVTTVGFFIFIVGFVTQAWTYSFNSFGRSFMEYVEDNGCSCSFMPVVLSICSLWCKQDFLTIISSLLLSEIYGHCFLLILLLTACVCFHTLFQLLKIMVLAGVNGDHAPLTTMAVWWQLYVCMQWFEFDFCTPTPKTVSI